MPHVFQQKRLLVLPVIALMILGLLYPSADHHFNWIIACLALIYGLFPFVHSFLEKKQERPNLEGWITKISESGKGEPQVTYSAIVLNTGNQDTELVDAFLILEGQKRDNAIQLCVFPQDIIVPPDGKMYKIAARSQKPFLLEDMGHKIADYCNSKGTIYLRDATNREYPIRVGKIVPGARGRRISDLPVRED